MGAELLASGFAAGRRGLPRLRRYGWALIAPGFTLVAAFAMNAIASRRLGPTGFAQFAVASTLVTLLGLVTTLGVPTTLVAVSASGDPRRGSDTWRAAGIAIVWVAGSVVAIALLAAEAALGARAARWFPPGTALAIGIAGLGTALLEVALAESQRDLAFRRYFTRMFGGSLTRLAGVAIGVFAFAATPRSAIWGYAIATFASGAILSAAATHGAIGRLRGDARQLRHDIAGMLDRSAPVVGSAIVVAAMSWIDTLVIASYMPAADVGTYAAAVRLTIIPTTLIGGMTSLALPLAARAWHERRVDDYNRRALRGGIGVGLGVVAALCASAGLLVRLVYGAEFAAAAPVFMVLVLGLLPNFACNPMSQLLFASGRTRMLAVTQTVQLAALLTGLGALASWGGPLAIAWMRTGVNVVATATIMAVALRMGRRTKLAVPRT